MPRVNELTLTQDQIAFDELIECSLLPRVFTVTKTFFDDFIGLLVSDFPRPFSVGFLSRLERISKAGLGLRPNQD